MEAIQFQKTYLLHITFDRSYDHNIVFVYLPLHIHTQFLLIVFLLPLIQCKSTIPHQKLFQKLQCHLGTDYYVLAGNPFDEDGEVDAYSNVAIAIQLLDASTRWKQMMEDCNPNEPVTLTNEHFICVAMEVLQKWEYGLQSSIICFHRVEASNN